jgi:hypothetical protein
LVLNIVAYATDKLEELFPNIMGKGLGQLKLEHEIEQAVFLAPKCYILITTSLGKGEKIIKIKGFNLNSETFLDKGSELNLVDFVSLLKKDANTTIVQNIWVKDKTEALISTIDQAYNLAPA